MTAPPRLLSLLLGAVLSLTVAPLPAQLRLSPSALDFGERGHEEQPTLALVLENTGTEPLVVAALKPNCSCITVSPPSLSGAIAPGSSEEVLISMSSGRAIGILEKRLEVLVGGGRPGSFLVPLIMRVHEGFQVEPHDLRFDGVVGGEPLTRSVEVKRRKGPRDAPFTLAAEGVKGAGPREAGMARHFRWSVADTAGGKRVDLVLEPTHPEGRIWGSLLLKLNGRPLVVPVAGEMFRSIKVVPTYFNFSAVAAADPGTFLEESVLTSVDGRPFRILEVKPEFTRKPGEETSLEVHEISPSAGLEALQHVLRARIVKGTRPIEGDSYFSGKVIVKTSHPEKAEVTLTFMGFFAPPRR
jgi:hypothetical protein